MCEDRELEAALYDDAGEPLPITKIEIEPLPAQEAFRWSLYSGSRRIYSTEGTALDVRAALEGAIILVESALGLPPPVSA